MAEPRRRRRGLSPARRRLLLQVLGVVVIVGMLLWGADTLARIGAQTLLERNVEDATGVEVRPEVDVHGLFFLPQVIRGAYSDVHVATLGIDRGYMSVVSRRSLPATFIRVHGDRTVCEAKVLYYSYPNSQQICIGNYLIHSL